MRSSGPTRGSGAPASPEAPHFARQCSLALLLLKHHRYGLTREQIMEEMRDFYFSPQEKRILDSEGNEKDKERVMQSKRKMFQRDREALRAAGVIIDSDGERKGKASRYRVTAEGLSFKQGELDPFRGAQLVLALSSMKELGGELFSEELRSIRLKWGLESPDEDLKPLLLHLPADVDRRLFERLFEAVQKRTPVSFSYRGTGDGDYLRRRVQPLALVYRWGNWNLSAYDLEKEGYRTFRVSRIKQSEGDLKELPGEKRRELPDEKKAVLEVLATQPWNMGEDPPTQVTVDFEAKEAERVRRMFGDSATVERAEGGKVRMVIRARNLEVLASRLFRFGGGAEIISPQEAREAAASLLRRMVEAGERRRSRC
jgi:predicted DNA-binding transcriptional regulator YafY